jgi:hypothetical protein
MKRSSVLTLVSISSFALLVGSGCKPSQSGSGGTSSDTTAPAEQKSVTETVQEAGETAKKVMADTNAQAQELITKAQKLVSEKNYEGAMNLMNELKNFKLTPEQEKLVQDLKTTIQKALESQALSEGTKALGEALGGKKQTAPPPAPAAP